MGAAVTPQDGKQSRKTLDAELNLVPFIDLLVCCICFLLITAVWTRIATVPAARQQSGGDQRELTPAVPVTVTIADDGYVILRGPSRQVLPRVGRHFDDEGLGRVLRSASKASRDDAQLTVAVQDGIEYRHIVRVMDMARQRGFGRIHVSDLALAL